MPEFELAKDVRMLKELLLEFGTQMHAKAVANKNKKVSIGKSVHDQGFEAQCAQRVYARANALDKSLQTLITEQSLKLQQWMASRGTAYPVVDMKSYYKTVKQELETYLETESTSKSVLIPRTHTAGQTGFQFDMGQLRLLAGKKMDYQPTSGVVSEEDDEDVDAEDENIPVDQKFPLPESPRMQSIPPTVWIAEHLGLLEEAFQKAEVLVDCYFCDLFAQLTTLAVAEMLGKKEMYSEFLTNVHSTASKFMRVGLPLLEQVLQVEVSFTKENLVPLSFKGIGIGSQYSTARQLVRKFRILNSMYASLDIHMFPPSFKAHDDYVKAIAVSQLDEGYLATGGYDNAVRIWNIKDKQCIAQFVGHKSVVTWCKFMSTDFLLVTCSLDGTIRIWDTKRATLRRTLQGHNEGVLCADVSPNEKYIVSGGMDCKVRLWDVEGKELRVYSGHTHWVKNVVFADTGMNIVSQGLDYKIRVWKMTLVRVAQVATNPCSVVIDLPGGYGVDMGMFSVGEPRVQMIVVVPKDEHIRIYDKEGLLRQVLTDKVSVLSISAHHHLPLMAAGFFDHTILIYNTNDWTIQRRIRVHCDGIAVVRWLGKHPNSLVIGTISGVIKIINWT